MDTASIHKPSIHIHASTHVKARWGHVLIKIRPCPPLPEADLVHMSLQYFLYDLTQLDGVRGGKIHRGVIVGIEFADFLMEDGVTPGGQCDVVVHTLKPPPGSVSAVVARVTTTIQEVRKETVTNAGPKGKNVVTKEQKDIEVLPTKNFLRACSSENPIMGQVIW